MIESEISSFLCDVAKTRPQDCNADQVYDWALHLNPDNPQAWSGKGAVRSKEKNFAESIPYHIKAAEILNTPAAYLNASLAAFGQGDYSVSRDFCQRALAIDPRFQAGLLHLSAILTMKEKYQEAIDTANACYELNHNPPTQSHPLFTRGIARFLSGDIKGGWEDYEYRDGRLKLLSRMDEYDYWTGQDLKGKLILVFGEQGFGDEIMFSRGLNIFRGTGARVIYHTRPELARLFANSYPHVKVTTGSREIKDLTPDYWFASGSLGKFIYPQPLEPYLYSNKSKSRYLFPSDNIQRVGLCWTGNPEFWRNGPRSFTWEQFEGLYVEHCEKEAWAYGLQYNDRTSGLLDLNLYCMDFQDKANIIANLDVVITCDTSIAHLAGALGTPVKLLYKDFVEWRWKVNTWYPELELIKVAI